MLKPREDYVALTIEKEEKSTASGIILTSLDKEKQSIGKVYALGDKVESLSIGDRVIYQNYAGTKVDLNDQTFILIEAKNILATLL